MEHEKERPSPEMEYIQYQIENPEMHERTTPNLKNNMENKTVSLELARELKEAGIEIETEFYWAEFYNKSSTVPEKKLYQIVFHYEREDFEERSHLSELIFYPAPLLSELLEILPVHTNLQKYTNEYFIDNVDYCDEHGKRDWETDKCNDDCDSFFASAPHPAEAAGKLLLQLKREGLV